MRSVAQLPVAFRKTLSVPVMIVSSTEVGTTLSAHVVVNAQSPPPVALLWTLICVKAVPVLITSMRSICKKVFIGTLSYVVALLSEIS
jgi:hypothetical protein